jgi:hypothetical protein
VAWAARPFGSGNPAAAASVPVPGARNALVTDGEFLFLLDTIRVFCSIPCSSPQGSAVAPGIARLCDGRKEHHVFFRGARRR